MKRPLNQAGPHRPGPSGEGIRADELLPWACLHDRLGWGARALASARAQGLRVLRFGKWQYVLGRDVIAFLERVQTGNPDSVSGDKG
jgi:hypothetical protein